MSTSTADDGVPQDVPTGGSASAWPALPTETEIYLLPDGQVIIADMPAELAHLAARLGGIPAVEDDSAPSLFPSNRP